MQYEIEIGTRETTSFIDDMIVEYNKLQVPYKQDPTFISINRIIKDEKGEVIAGINSVLYCWNCLYVDILWVNEKHRGASLGSKLLDEAIKIAISKGCSLVHLDTFDFQARDFYIKQGFEVFGVLEDCPEGHKRYYLKKNL